MPVARLSAGPIEYADTGGDGPVVVLLHGLAMDGRVWREVLPELGQGVRCILPTLPLALTGSRCAPTRICRCAGWAGSSPSCWSDSSYAT